MNWGRKRKSFSLKRKRRFFSKSLCCVHIGGLAFRLWRACFTDEISWTKSKQHITRHDRENYFLNWRWSFAVFWWKLSISTYRKNIGSGNKTTFTETKYCNSIHFESNIFFHHICRMKSLITQFCDILTRNYIHDFLNDFHISLEPYIIPLKIWNKNLNWKRFRQLNLFLSKRA